MTNQKGVIVQSVVRSMEIINCFTNVQELGISEIAEYMDLSKSTVYGLVNTLTAYGYLEQSDNKKYRLGLKLFELGNRVYSRMDIRNEARPWCKKLADKYNTTAHLFAYFDDKVIYIDKVDNANSAIAYSRIGRTAPMYCTGGGKAILANLPTEYLEKYVLSVPREKITDHTITTREDLLKELEKTKERGYATDKEETEVGLSCVAAPILDVRRHPLGAISVSFPLGRMQEYDEKMIAEDVMKYALIISKRMGYRD